MHFPIAIINWWVFASLLYEYAGYLHDAIYTHNFFSFSLAQLRFEIGLIFIGITDIIWNVIMGLLTLCFKEDMTLEETALYICPVARSKPGAIRKHCGVIS